MPVNKASMLARISSFTCPVLCADISIRAGLTTSAIAMGEANIVAKTTPRQSAVAHRESQGKNMRVMSKSISASRMVNMRRNIAANW